MRFSKEDIIKLVVPLMCEQLLAVSVGLVDTLMVSKAGDAAISGVALVDNINRLVIQIMAALATGGAVVCSQYIGRKDEENSRKSNAQLHLIMMAVSLMVLAIALLFTRQILTAIFGKVEADVLDNAVLYFTVTAFSYPFLALYNAGGSVFRSQGNSKISMQISIVMNIINIIANAVLVFGFRLSVLGVALATDLSRIVAGILMLYFIVQKKNPLCFKGAADFKPDTQMLSRILKIGIPSGIENGMFQIGKLMVVSMVALFGTASIAANAVGYTIIDFANIPAGSMGLALVTLIGQCVGAGEYDQAKYYTKKSLKIAYLGDWCAKLILFICAGMFCSFFNLSVEAYEIAVQILRCFCIASIPVWPLSFTLPNALRASGDVAFTMVVSIISMWIFRIGSSYILSIVCGMGVLGVWLGMFIDWYARGICFSIRYLKNRWLNRQLI